METIAEDPELAQDILKLYHSKLRQARQELQQLREASTSETALIDSTELRSKNEELKEQLTSLRLQLSAALDGQDTKDRPATGDSHDMAGQDERLQDTEVRQADDREMIEAMKAKLMRYNEKTMRVRSETLDLEKTLSVLRGDLAEERRQSRDFQSRMAATEAELAKQRRSAIQAFEPAAFLSTVSRTVVNLPEKASLKPIMHSQPLSTFPTEIVKRFERLKMLILSPKELVWSKDGITRALYVTRSYHYDPTVREESKRWVVGDPWHDTNRGVARDQELFVRAKNDWFYYGTYRQTGHSPLSDPLSVGSLTPVVQHTLNTLPTTNQDHLAPVVAQFLTSCNSSTDGPLRLNCFGIERVGFCQELYTTLLASRKAILSLNSQLACGNGKKSESHGPKQGSAGKGKKSKRPCSEADSVGPKKKKKKKKN